MRDKLARFNGFIRHEYPLAQRCRGFPRGYDTLLARQFKDGAELSGGQWQRVAVARGFYRSAPLLIMDEPTAALDARAEYALFASSAGMPRAAAC